MKSNFVYVCVHVFIVFGLSLLTDTHHSLCGFQRSPDTSKVRNKMIYASSKDSFKRELDGIQVELQATDPTEMGLDVIRSRAN